MLLVVRVSLLCLLGLFYCSLKDSFFFLLCRHHWASIRVYCLHYHISFGNSLLDFIHGHCYLNLTEVISKWSYLFSFSQSSLITFKFTVIVILVAIWVLFSISSGLKLEDLSFQFRIFFFQVHIVFTVSSHASFFGCNLIFELLYFSPCNFQLSSKGVRLVKFFSNNFRSFAFAWRYWRFGLRRILFGIDTDSGRVINHLFDLLRGRHWRTLTIVLFVLIWIRVSSVAVWLLSSSSVVREILAWFCILFLKLIIILNHFIRVFCTLFTTIINWERLPSLSI